MCIVTFFVLRATLAEGLSVGHILDSIQLLEGAANTDLSVVSGLHVVYSWPGGTVPQELYDLTKEGKVGGVIIFGENVNDDLPRQMAKLQNVYKKSPGYIGHPLLVVTDQEGGIVVRLPGGPKKSEKDIGSSVHPVAAASRAGTVAATACKSYNVNGEPQQSPLQLQKLSCSTLGRKSCTGAGCLSQSRRLRRSVRTLVQHGSTRRREMRLSVYQFSAISWRRCYQQALAGTGSCFSGREHRSRSSNPECASPQAPYCR